MKRIAFYALHYGVEYLPWSVRSVQQEVDEIHVLYTPKPSFGFTTAERCPESEAELRAAAERFLERPLFWHRGDWKSEGAHRDAGRAMAEKAGSSLMVVVDADEVWDRATLGAALREAEVGREHTLVRMVHYFRSLKWMCSDGSMPVRLINLRSEGSGALAVQRWPVFHLGYAQSLQMVRYKWLIHGHLSELRRGWLDRFGAWQPGQGDMHPTNENFWTPEPSSTALEDKLRELLPGHPYWDHEVIP
jgi:hypothetical protein